MNKANNLNSSGKSTANLVSFKYQSCNFWTDRTNKEKLLIKNKNMSMKKLFISVETQQRKNCEFEIFFVLFFHLFHLFPKYKNRWVHNWMNPSIVYLKSWKCEFRKNIFLENFNVSKFQCFKDNNDNVKMRNFFCLIKMWKDSGIGSDLHNQWNWFKLG